VPLTWNYSLLITLVNDTLTRLKPVRVADHLMAFSCRRLRRGFRRGGCNVVATLPVNVDPKTSLPLTSSIHYKNRPTKRRPALASWPSEGNGRATLPVEEWFSQPIARIGCCVPLQLTLLPAATAYAPCRSVAGAGFELARRASSTGSLAAAARSARKGTPADFRPSA
jgi:hypothetical protein